MHHRPAIHRTSNRLPNIDIRQWPTRIEAVEPAAIIAAARKHLDRHKAVTGHLLPPDDEPVP